MPTVDLSSYGSAKCDPERDTYNSINRDTYCNFNVWSDGRSQCSSNGSVLPSVTPTEVPTIILKLSRWVFNSKPLKIRFEGIGTLCSPNNLTESDSCSF